MNKAAKKLAAVVIWAGIGVLAGMQLGGSDGALVRDVPSFGQVRQEDSLSPGTSGAVQEQPGSPAPVPVKEESPAKPKFEPLPRDILLPDAPRPPADVLADKTAGLLQDLSNQSIRWVVSLFGAITD